MYIIVLIFWAEFMPAVFKQNINYSLGAYGHMYTRIREVEKSGPVDILFIGSSHAYRGFDTRIAKEYGYTSFNLGSSAQTPVQTKLLLDEYLDKLKPKMVVYEVCPYIFTNDGVESSLDIIANGKIDLNVLKMTASINHIKTYNNIVYAYYRELFNRNKNFKENKVIAYDTYIAGGFVERTMMNNEDSALVKIEKIEWAPKAYQLAAFEKIIKLAKEKGVKLILVQAPVTKPEYAKYRANDSINNYFAEKATYYNFNNYIKLSDTLDFYNKDHLNQKGIRIFNTALMDSIAQNK